MVKFPGGYGVALLPKPYCLPTDLAMKEQSHAAPATRKFLEHLPYRDTEL